MKASILTQRTARFRILLVADDFIVAGELKSWLQEAPFDVTGLATTAADAVAAHRLRG